MNNIDHVLALLQKLEEDRANSIKTADNRVMVTQCLLIVLILMAVIILVRVECAWRTATALKRGLGPEKQHSGVELQLATDYAAGSEQPAQPHMTDATAVSVGVVQMQRNPIIEQ